MADAAPGLNSLNILNQLLTAQPPENSDTRIPMKIKEQNLQAIQNGEFPEGTDIDSIIAQAMIEIEMQQNDPNIREAEAKTTENLNRTYGLEVEVQQELLRLREANAATADATLQSIDVESDIAKSRLEQELRGNSRINSLFKEIESNRDDIQAALKQNQAELTRDFGIVQQTGSINVADFIKNPLAYASALQAKFGAERRIESNLLENQSLEQNSNFQSSLFQQRVSDIQTVSALKNRADNALYVRQIEVGSLLARSQAGQELRLANIAATKEALNINGAVMDQTIRGLESMRTRGTLSRQKIETALQAAQLKTAQLQLKQQKKMLADNEEMLSILDERAAMAAEAVGMGDVVKDFATFTTAVDSGLIPPEAASAISYAVSKGTIDTQAIFNSSSPTTVAGSLMSSGSEIVSEDIVALVARADQILYDGSNSVASQPGYINMNAQEAQAARDSALQQFYANAKNDGQLYLDNQLLALNSPNTLDYSPGNGLDAVPAAVVPMLQDLHVETRNMHLYTKDMANQLANKIADDGNMALIDSVAEGAAEVMALHLRDLQNRTGLGSEGLRTNRFADTPGIGNVDVTNPVVWKSRIESLVARKLAARAIRVQFHSIP